MGHDVTVYCRSYFTPALPKHEGMRLVRLPTFRSKHLETFVHTWLSTVHVMFRGCDIVHYHAQGPALFSFFPRLVGKKTIVTVQDKIGSERSGGGLPRLPFASENSLPRGCPTAPWSFRELFSAITRQRTVLKLHTCLTARCFANASLRRR